MDPSRGKTFPSEKTDMNWSNDNNIQPPKYDPSKYGAPPPQNQDPEGTLILVDENGQQVGALGEHINVAGVVPGSHEPVEIDLSSTNGVVTYYVRPSREYRHRTHKRSYTIPENYYMGSIPDHGQNSLGRASTFPNYSSNPYCAYDRPQKVRPIQPDYLKDAQDPAYASSRLVGTAATATRVLVTGATYFAKAVEAGAKTFTEKTKPVNTPMTFQPTTHNYVRQIHNYSSSGAKIASKTVGTVTHHAQNLGAKLAGKGEGYERDRKPGLFNKGLMAFGTIADGIDYASKLILTTTSQAATTVVGHRYGAEAEEMARGLTGVVKNVGLVYVDASGVSRRAIVKSVAKGMVVGRVKGGGEVIFEGNNTSQALLTQPAPTGPGAVAPGTPGQYQQFAPPPGQGAVAPGTPGQYQQFAPPPGQGSGRVSPVPPHYYSTGSSPMPPQSSQFSPPPGTPQHYSSAPSTPFKY